MTLSRFILSLLLAALPALVFANPATLQDATQAFRQGNTTAALNRVNSFLAAHPKDAQGRFLKGLILTEMNRHGEAIRQFTELTEDYPELPEPYNNLAVLYAAQGDYERAKQSLQMAIRTHPSYATAHENLGDIFAKMASQAYDKALQLDQSNTSVLTKLALIRDLFSPTARLGRQPAPPATAVPVTASAPVPALAPIVSTPATTLAQTQAVQPEPPPTAPSAPSGNVIGELENTVRAWAQAWSARDADAYLGFYGKGFKTPEGQNRESWEALRRERVTRPRFIKVTLDRLDVQQTSEDTAIATFRQRYASNLLRSTTNKTLNLAREDGAWKIVEEK